MTGYRAMIRDRMPENWVFILKQFKCLNKWIDMVYDDRVRKWNTHWNTKARGDGKSKAIKELVKDDFYMTLPLNLSENERKMWIAISHWIDWFDNRFLYIKQEYDFAIKKGEDPITAIYDIWNLPLDFTKAIIKYIENGQKA